MSLIPEKIFGLSVKILESSSTKRYPLYVSGLFEIKEIEIGDINCLALMTNDGISLRAIKSIVKDFSEEGQANVIICSKMLSTYQRNRLSEENIAFISGSIVYLPFMGIAITNSQKTALQRKPLSPRAQSLFIDIFSGKYLDKTLSDIAQDRGKSLSSVSRYIKEIESISPLLLEKLGREKRVRNLAATQRRTIFEQFRPYLINPVKERMYFRFSSDKGDTILSSFLFSGITALSRMTMISDDQEVTYAIGDSASSKEEIDNTEGLVDCANEQEEANVVIEVWSYEPKSSMLSKSFSDCVDEISLFMSLQDEAARDERVNKELELLLQRVLGVESR